MSLLDEAGLLPGALMRNSQLKFVCKDVHLRVERSDTPFTRGYNAGQVIRVPVDGIRIASRATKGVTIFNTADSEKVVSVERISEPQAEDNGSEIVAEEGVPASE